MRWLLYGSVTTLAVTGVVAVVLRIAEMHASLTGNNLPPADSFESGFVRWPVLTLLHILPGLVFIVLGPLQFVAAIRSRYTNLHRWCGRIYIASGVLVGISALVMGYVIGFGGSAETAAVTLFSLLFLACLGRAFVHIKRREIAAHREWMIRAFALGLAVATMRPMVGLLLGLAGLSLAEFLAAAFWLAFSMHLLLAELWVTFTRRERTPGISPRMATADASDST